MKEQLSTSTMRSSILLYWFILLWKSPLGVSDKFRMIEKSLILQINSATTSEVNQ